LYKSKATEGFEAPNSRRGFAATSFDDSRPVHLYAKHGALIN